MANKLTKVKLACASFTLIALIIPNLSQVTQPVQAQNAQPKFEQSATIEAKEIDSRAKILQNYLSLKNSPMQYSAQDFIEAADKHEVDWKLVPAIAGVESTFGKHVPGGTDPANSSFNAYGWGVYGNHALYFKSWKDGIYTLNQGLKEKYISRGLKDPYAMNKIYAASPTWGVRVDHFMKDIDAYSKKYQSASTTPSLDVIIASHKVQTSSAQLAAK